VQALRYLKVLRNEQKLTGSTSGVARGASGGTRPGAHQHSFCNHLKTHFKQKFMLKNA